MTEAASKTISFLRFPLILCVVWIHVGMTGPEYEGYCIFGKFCRLAGFLTQTAVPLFFLISGYLFFQNVSESPAKAYIAKLRRRVYSLLIPYVFWNAVSLLRYYLEQRYLDGHVSTTIPAVSQFTATDYLRAFWDLSGGAPVCFQFWFIRDLMVLAVISPVIYELVRHKYLKTVCLTVLIAAKYYETYFPVGLRQDSLLFFTLGAWLSVNQTDWVALTQKVRRPILALTFLYAVFYIFLNRHLSPLISYLGLFLVITAILGSTSHGISKGRIRSSRVLEESCFLIYAAHPLLLAPIKYLVQHAGFPQNDITLILEYVGIAGLTVTLLIGLSIVMKQWVPSFYGLVTGGRQTQLDRSRSNK